MHALLCMGRSCFLSFSEKGIMLREIVPIFCMLPISMISPSFRCWSILVSEIREFNRKNKKEKNKMNNQKMAVFNLSPSPWLNGTIIF